MTTRRDRAPVRSFREPSVRRRSPRPRREAPPDESSIALVAAEAFSLVVRACSTSVAIRTLQRRADASPALLITASTRCGQVEQLDHRIRAQAADLLRRAADDLRRDGADRER